MEEFEKAVKEALLHAGFRFRNRIRAIRHTGNGVDTLRRTAWYGYEVTWEKSPSRDLLSHLANLAPLRPTTQLYASDVDRINLVVSSTPATNAG
ncbi:hypothetical protein [Burkholderia sp. Ac-20365]|uniref:hypothetical protein n=1 Tax=Burkholderia sp. Ac-20365 TaxID=2703897 RepID=UPI00197CAE77|nr:hypothetical protein [Burkholderia sp. Ac-20365]MBN3760956.1 hypothetical protein [Burkholderia sp. Ac-20365]